MCYIYPPYLLQCEPLFEGNNACKAQESVSAQGGVAIVNHCAIVILLRVVNLLHRSFFSTTGSFGKSLASGCNCSIRFISSWSCTSAERSWHEQTVIEFRIAIPLAWKRISRKQAERVCANCLCKLFLFGSFKLS